MVFIEICGVHVVYFMNDSQTFVYHTLILYIMICLYRNNIYIALYIRRTQEFHLKEFQVICSLQEMESVLSEVLQRIEAPRFVLRRVDVQSQRNPHGNQIAISL